MSMREVPQLGLKSPIGVIKEFSVYFGINLLVLVEEWHENLRWVACIRRFLHHQHF